MLDHISLRVTDLSRSKKFYAAALAPLGYSLVMEFEGMCGFGVGGKPDFWLTQVPQTIPMHVAFASPDRKSVTAFHAAAMAAGATDNGAAGPRPHYHQNYFGAFVLDPDGHNIEAVIHRPE